MLVLSRDCNTAICIGPSIEVKVLAIRKRCVKLGIDAPKDVHVRRKELPVSRRMSQEGKEHDDGGPQQ